MMCRHIEKIQGPVSSNDYIGSHFTYTFCIPCNEWQYIIVTTQSISERRFYKHIHSGYHTTPIGAIAGIKK